MKLSARVTHEVRCPVHGFVRFNNSERDLINSAPMQRLKHVHQLAMTYQVYPGATHRRFEHSLGVMDLADRAFDSLMRREKLPYGAGLLPEAADDEVRNYWRRVLRVAALLHDTGHLPFSHAAENELLPCGKSHEDLTKHIIVTSEVSQVLMGCTPPIRPLDVVKIAVKPKHQPENKLSPWEGILNEILNGDTFGVDRIDYLLRDSHHAGVGYGRFDPLRLLDSLVIVPRPSSEQPSEGAPLEASNPESLTLGIFAGGIQGAEALLLARYFMYSQVYLHHVRRAYDIHLKDFMIAWFGDAKYPTELSKHLALTDNEVLSAISAASRDPTAAGHESAHRVENRGHFRRAGSLARSDWHLGEGGNPKAPELLQEAFDKHFGPSNVRVDCIPPGKQQKSKPDVLVVLDDGSTESGLERSDVLRHIPEDWCAFILTDKLRVEEVARFLRERKGSILRSA